MAMSKLKESVVKTVDDVTLLDQESEDDILEIVGAVSRITAKYRQLGIGLGLLPSKIDEIEKKRKTSSSVRDKLSEVIRLRLDQLPAPTWKTFIDAAKPINPALAERVARTVPGDTTLDVRTVTEKFKSISAKYYQFGANLKVPTFELDGIRSEMSIHDLLHDVVLEFLTSRREKYKSTWRTIVDAVFDINPALAKEIAEKHKAKGQAPPSTTALKVEGSGSQVHESPHPSTASTRGTKRSGEAPNGVTTDGNTDSDDHLLSPKRAKPISVQASTITGSAKLGGPVQIAEQWKLMPLHKKDLNGQGVTIVILDTFVDSTSGPICMKGQQVPSDDCIMVVEGMNENNDHGTNCAIIAAGAPYHDPDREFKFYGGVAPAASLVCYRVSPDGKDFHGPGVVQALDKILANQNPDAGCIISMSFGCEKLIKEITEHINMLTQKKFVCVAAAGNDGPPKQVEFPACLGNVISVGSCTSTGQPSNFNNMGNIDVYAPGENLVPNRLIGTSYAVPAIAGIIALLMQLAKNLNDPTMFKSICDVNILRRIFTYDLKARGVDVLAPHELLQDGPEKLEEVIRKYI